MFTCCDQRPHPSHQEALFFGRFEVAKNDYSQYEEWIEKDDGVGKGHNCKAD